MPRLRTTPKPSRPLAQTVDDVVADLIARKVREDAAWLKDVEPLTPAQRAQALTWLTWAMRPGTRRVSHVLLDGTEVQDPPLSSLVRVARQQALAADAAERGREAAALGCAISEPTLSQILAAPDDRPGTDGIR